MHYECPIGLFELLEIEWMPRVQYHTKILNYLVVGLACPITPGLNILRGDLDRHCIDFLEEFGVTCTTTYSLKLEQIRKHSSTIMQVL